MLTLPQIVDINEVQEQMNLVHFDEQYSSQSTSAHEQLNVTGGVEVSTPLFPVLKGEVSAHYSRTSRLEDDQIEAAVSIQATRAIHFGYLNSRERHLARELGATHYLAKRIYGQNIVCRLRYTRKEFEESEHLEVKCRVTVNLVVKKVTREWSETLIDTYNELFEEDISLDWVVNGETVNAPDNLQSRLSHKELITLRDIVDGANVVVNTEEVPLFDCWVSLTD